MGVDVKSEVAGRVWQIVAGEGETVAADDPIVILESMKMEIPVLSPVAAQSPAWRLAKRICSTRSKWSPRSLRPADGAAPPC